MKGVASNRRLQKESSDARSSEEKGRKKGRKHKNE
jgi:hypothetical protein